MGAAGFVGSRRYWAGVAAYVIALFAVQPFLGLGIDAFKELWGDGALDLTAGIITAVGGAAAAGLVARTWRRASAGQRIAVLAGGLLFGFGVTVARFPQERLHYLEYGVLAALLYVGFSTSGGGVWRAEAAVRTVVVGAGLGLADEALQIAWPRRYFDWADVLLNVIAVGLGLLVAIPAWGAWSRSPPIARRGS